MSAPVLPRTNQPGAATSSSNSTDERPPRSDWRILLAIFWVTSIVETAGMGQVFAFLPDYLRQMGVAGPDRLTFVGIFSSLIFVVGAPFVPLWGVWADKYSRKAVIVRSALVEAVVFAAIALSREPWELALSLLLVGLQLGNTGVMLAALRDVAPRHRIGAAIGFFGSSTALGFALGPIVGGLIVDGLHFPLSAVYALSSALSIGTAILVSLTREVRPSVVPQGRVLTLAYGAVKSVLTEPTVRRLFIIYFIAFVANQMSRPFVPVLIEGLVGTGPGLASSIGLVTGVAALIGALSSPIGGMSGDRFGFRTVLTVGLGGGAVALALQPWAPSLPLLALAVLVFVAFNAIVGPMIFSLLATEVPEVRRSATLNLVYLPLYAAGAVGPATGALMTGIAGVPGPFLLAAAVLAVGAVAIFLTSRKAPGGSGA